MPGAPGNFNKAGVIAQAAIDNADFFFDRVAPIMDDRGCWEWVGHINRGGYGSLTVWSKEFQKKQTVTAHRFSWAMHFGVAPDGLNVCHRCDNPSCVNPAHLFLGTTDENVKDRHSKGRTATAEEAPRAKLSNQDVALIRVMLKSGLKQRDIAEMYGVSRTAITWINTGRNWRTV